MKTFFLKNLPKRFVYKNPEKREAVAAQVESREKTKLDLETEEKAEREKLQKEYEMMKRIVDSTSEELGQVEKIVDQIPEELGPFAKLKKARAKLDTAVEQFRSIDMSDVSETLREAAQKIEETGKQFEEFKDTLILADQLKDDQYFNGHVSGDEFRESRGEGPLFDKLFALEKDAKKILRILDLFEELEWSGDIRSVEFALKERKSDVIIRNLENLLKHKRKLSIRELSSLIFHFFTKTYISLDDYSIKCFVDNKRKLEKLAKQKGLDKKGFNEGQVLHFLDDAPFLDATKVAEYVDALANNPTKKLELHHIKELHRNCKDLEKVMPLIGLFEDGLNVYEIAAVSTLEGSGPALYDYFHEALVSGFFAKMDGKEFDNIVFWREHVDFDIIGVLDVLGKLQGFNLTNSQLKEVYDETIDNEHILDLIHLVKDGFSYDIVLAFSKTEFEPKVLLEHISSLKNVDFDNRAILSILAEAVLEKNFDPKNIVEYCVALKSSGLVSELHDIGDWFKIEANSSQVIKFLTGAKRLGLHSDPIRIHYIQPSIDKIEDNIDFVRSVQDPEAFIEKVDGVVKRTNARGRKRHRMRVDLMKINSPRFSELEAISLIETLENKNATDGGYYYFLERNLTPPTEGATALWVLTGNKIPSKDDIGLWKFDRKGKGSLLIEPLDQVTSYVNGLKSRGITDPQLILGLWRASRVPEYAAETYFFLKNNKFKALNNPKNFLSSEKMLILCSICYKCKDNPARTALVKHIFEGTGQMANSNLDSFLSDPSLPVSEAVYSNMRVKNAELALRIGRTMFFHGIDTNRLGEITPELVDSFSEGIDETMENYREMLLFKDRNVLLIPNNETWDDGSPRFNTEEMVKGIKDSNPTSFKVLSPKENASAGDLDTYKLNVLEHIKNTPPPLTMIFTGHGGPKEFYHYHGQIRGEMPDNSNALNFLSSDEIAEAMIARAEKFGKSAVKTDFYSFHSCFSANFVRDVRAKVAASEKGQIPIMGSEAEYGQYGFSHGGPWGRPSADEEHSVLGIYHPDTSSFLDRYFGPAQTIGGIIDNESRSKDSNYTLIVPTDDGGSAQIVKADEKKRPDQRGREKAA